MLRTGMGAPVPPPLCFWSTETHPGQTSGHEALSWWCSGHAVIAGGGYLWSGRTQHRGGCFGVSGSEQAQMPSALFSASSPLCNAPAASDCPTGCLTP